MKQRTHLLSVVGLVALFAGCATQPSSRPVYPEHTGGQPVTDLSQFDVLAEQADATVGQEVKLAGRIKGLKATDQGYEVFASWLPYPQKQALEVGPRDPEVDPGRRFLIHFKGKRERIFLMTIGNKFVLDGTVNGTKRAVADMKPLLYVNTNCVKVWETGQSGLSDSPDSEYPGARSRTLCADQ